MLVLRGLFRCRNTQDVVVSGHRLTRKCTGITQRGTAGDMLQSDATSPRRLPAIIISTLSGTTRSRTRQGPSDPWKSRRSRIRGLHDRCQRHRHRRIYRRIRKPARFRENRGMHPRRKGTFYTISFRFPFSMQLYFKSHRSLNTFINIKAMFTSSNNRKVKCKTI